MTDNQEIVEDQEMNESSTLDKLVKYLPLGSALLIILGVLKTSVYYNWFGVDIMSYLSITEVLTLFLNDYVSLITILFVGIAHLLLSAEYFHKTEELIGEDVFESKIKKYKWVLFSIFTLISTVLGLMLYNGDLPLLDITIYLFVFFAVQMIVTLFLSKKKDKDINMRPIMNFLLLIVIGSIVPLMSAKDIQEVEQLEGQKVTLTMTNSELIQSDSLNLYLGKAGAYYFFYNSETEVTRIIKAEDVKEVEILN